jgi:conserved oligomeric Golgi complex subunit 6
VTPPLPILDHAQILREIMSVYQSSLLSEDDVNADDDDDDGDDDDGEDDDDDDDDDNTDERGGAGTRIRAILDVMVDPAVEMCINAGVEKKGRGVQAGWDGPVFTINCLTYLQVRPCVMHVHCFF